MITLGRVDMHPWQTGVWVQMAEAIDDPATCEGLARCTALEQESSQVVKELLAGVRAN